MISTKTIAAGVIGTGLAGLAGWVGVSSIGSIVAPPGDFSFLATVPRNASAESRSSAVVDQEAASSYVASAADAAPRVVKASAPVVAVAPIPESTSTSVSLAVPTSTTSTLNEIQVCTYETKQFPNYNHLVINEVAWMGTKADSSDEWIELKNISEEPLQLEGYQVIDKAEQIKVTLPKATLPPGGLYLLERAEEGDQVLEGSLVYTGALSNSNEGLRLFDRYCFLTDQVEALPKWPAGEASGKKSMERGGGMNWYTYSGLVVDGILGTPGRVNSAPTSTVTQPAATAMITEPEQTPVSPPQPPPTEEPPVPVFAAKAVISKIQTTGGPGKTTEDFVELYNPGPGSFNLKGYRLVKRTKTGTSDTSLKSWTADALITEGGVYRWANTNYPGSADIRTSGSVADDNAVALRKGSEDTGEVIDAVGWGAAANALVEGAATGVNPSVGQLLVRKNNQDTDNNAADFEVQ